MVVIMVSKKRQKIEDQVRHEIKTLLSKIAAQYGIKLFFISDSIEINNGIDKIANTIGFLLENSKLDTQIKKTFKQERRDNK